MCLDLVLELCRWIVCFDLFRWLCRWILSVNCFIWQCANNCAWRVAFRVDYWGLWVLGLTFHNCRTHFMETIKGGCQVVVQTDQIHNCWTLYFAHRQRRVSDVDHLHIIPMHLHLYCGRCLMRLLLTNAAAVQCAATWSNIVSYLTYYLYPTLPF